jgi:hypothetical protein
MSNGEGALMRAKRARTVHNSHMVCHLWASQSQGEARNGSRSLFFERETVYSYGSHFPIARLHMNKRGERAALFNPRHYSQTTSCHQHMARCASRHMPQFTVPSFAERRPGHAKNLRSYRERIKEAALALCRARTSKDWKARLLEELVAEANAYSTFFGLRARFQVPSDQEVQAALTKARQEVAHRRRQELERQQRARQEAERAIEQWRARKDVSVPWHVQDVFLRVREKDGEQVVETSKGAVVPLSHAVRILPLIRSGIPYQHNGHSIHVGQFRIDEIDAEGNVRAGCHFIKRAEMERLAVALGL